MTSAKRRDFKAEAGAGFTYTHKWVDAAGSPVDITGYAALLNIASDFVNGIDLALTERDGLTLGGVAGTIAIVLTGARTAYLGSGLNSFYAALAAQNPNLIRADQSEIYRYDLIVLPPSGAMTRLLHGRLVVARKTCNALRLA